MGIWGQSRRRFPYLCAPGNNSSLNDWTSLLCPLLLLLPRGTSDSPRREGILELVVALKYLIAAINYEAIEGAFPPHCVQEWKIVLLLEIMSEFQSTVNHSSRPPLCHLSAQCCSISRWRRRSPCTAINIVIYCHSMAVR